MKVLVACEFSGVVRDAFIAAGHQALSCDFLPCESTKGRPIDHYQGDVLDILWWGWDLMIAHPPCTFLCNSGVVWLNSPRYPNRWLDMAEGALFFKKLLEAPNIKYKAVENPIMHGYASDIIGRKRDQIIHPYEFGHLEQKATCLWLENLPPLVPTSDLRVETKALPYAIRHRLDWKSPGPNRAKERSVTYTGIAEAMATQWGSL